VLLSSFYCFFEVTGTGFLSASVDLIVVLFPNLISTTGSLLNHSVPATIKHNKLLPLLWLFSSYLSVYFSATMFSVIYCFSILSYFLEGFN